MPGLREQKQTNLRHVCPRGDVNKVVLCVRIERVSAREREESFVDLLEVPGIVERDFMKADFGFRRNRLDVGSDNLCQSCVASGVDQLEALYDEVRLPAKGDGGAPELPAVGVLAEVESGTQQAEDYQRLFLSINLRF